MISRIALRLKHWLAEGSRRTRRPALRWRREWSQRNHCHHPTPFACGAGTLRCGLADGSRMISRLMDKTCF
jgi:hypothetical protein